MYSVTSAFKTHKLPTSYKTSKNGPYIGHKRTHEGVCQKICTKKAPREGRLLRKACDQINFHRSILSSTESLGLTNTWKISTEEKNAPVTSGIMM